MNNTGNKWVITSTSFDETVLLDDCNGIIEKKYLDILYALVYQSEICVIM